MAVRSDATLVLSNAALGTKYRVSSHRGLGFTTYQGSMFLVVATQDQTRIQTFDTTGALVDDEILHAGQLLQRIQNPLMTG